MIEILPSESGDLVIKSGEFYLSSRLNPKREAERFINRFSFLNVENVIFFGLNSGYKILTLLKKYPHLKIMAVEPDPRCIEAVKRIHGSALSSLAISCVSNRAQVFGSLCLQKHLLRPYKIIIPQISTQVYPELFTKNLEYDLLGRTVEGARFISALRGRSWTINSELSEGELVSIKNISVDTAPIGEQMQIKLLKELVI